MYRWFKIIFLCFILQTIPKIITINLAGSYYNWLIFTQARIALSDLLKTKPCFMFCFAFSFIADETLW